MLDSEVFGYLAVDGWLFDGYNESAWRQFVCKSLLSVANKKLWEGNLSSESSIFNYICLKKKIFLEEQRKIWKSNHWPTSKWTRGLPKESKNWHWRPFSDLAELQPRYERENAVNSQFLEFQSRHLLFHTHSCVRNVQPGGAVIIYTRLTHGTSEMFGCQCSRSYRRPFKKKGSVV